MIEIRDLTKKYGDRMAVDHVSLSIPGGQICGYLGPNGAGKTTTVGMLTGLLQPSEGSAEVAGYDIKSRSLEVKKRIGVVPESGAVYQALTPAEYLRLSADLHHMDREDAVTRISELAVFLELQDRLHDRMSGFSKGMKQKVVIMASLLHRPDVLFLDEPLNGLDANTALRLKTLLQNMAEEGKTIFYCSHIMEVVENLCHRVVIIDQGKVVADGSVDQLKEMTRRSSLEGVFSELTHAEDAGEMVKLFSKRLAQQDD